MIKKIFKNIKNKNSKVTFKYNQAEILSFFKENIAVSILIMLVILFITIGNSFVVGALIGGYIGAKRCVKLNKVSSSVALILGTSIGAVLGGATLIFTVTAGALFHVIGSIIGVVAGGAAIIVFAGGIIEAIANKLIDLSSVGVSRTKSNMAKNNTAKKSKPRLRRKSKKLRLKAT